MSVASLKALIIRHRYSLRDLSVVIAAVAVMAYLAFNLDIFVQEAHATDAQKTIELDETLLLGGLLTVGLLIFSIRRYLDQKREMRSRIAAEHQARQLAFEDQLTGLPNRRQFEEAMAQALIETPGAGRAHGLFMLDLNGFKHINDTYGHGTGDRALMAVAGRLRGAMRTGDMVARFGGDEFAILSRNLSDPEAATTIALRVIKALKLPVRIDQINHDIGAGIGIALFPQNADTAEELKRKADVALYRAKAERRSALRFFDEEMDQQVNERAMLERELRQALAGGAIRTVFRPVLNLKTQKVAVFEAFPAWVTPENTKVATDRFLALAEDIGLIHEIAAQTLSQACEAARHWPRNVRVSIDLYPAQLKTKDMPLRMAAAMMSHGLTPDRLEVRLPETVFVTDADAAVAALQAMRVAGISVTLTHFGAGYSTLAQLRRFKPDRIQIDRSLVTAAQDSDGKAALSAMIGLGRGLGLEIGADGLTSDTDLQLLLTEGCQLARSDTYGDALTAEEAAWMLQPDVLSRVAP